MIKHTPLFQQHLRDASVVINLKGFARAMQYHGHRAEHAAVRERAGLCDVSHMGEIEFKGAQALALVQKLITNDARRLVVNQALYSVMCDDRGMVIDDLVCLRLADDHFLWVVNVTKTDEDFQWVLKHGAGMDVAIRNLSTDTALMALQGPESRAALQRITQADLSDLKYYWLTQTSVHTAHGEVPCIISRTGYTGELGYEIMAARDAAPWVWDELLLVGRPLGIVPAGVAARESLRTEAGYLLNGNDMDGETNPFEAGLGWTVKLSKDFVGRDALRRIQEAGIRRKLVGLEVLNRCTIRHGCLLYRNDAEIGRVTSGPLWSPEGADRSLGLGYVAAECADPGTQLVVDVRGARHPVRVVPLPLRPRRVKQEPALATYSPYDLKYSEFHVWARREDDDVVALGLTDFGQRSLGDILSAALPRVGERVERTRPLGWLDSYRKSLDIVSPVTGVVVAVDGEALRRPGRINAYPYLRSGLVKVRVASHADYDALADFHEYAERVGRLQRYESWASERRTV